MSFDPQILVDFMTRYGLQVVGGVVILVIGYMLAGFVGRSVRKAAKKTDRIPATLKPLLATLARLAILVVTVIAVLNQFGVETTSLIAVLGAAGLAIGLALQGALSNVASGVMLLVLRPFGVGDRVSIGGQTLIVDKIGLFVTEAHTPNNVYTVLPNSRVWGTEIQNMSRNPERRLDMVFGIGYGDDMGQAIEAVREVLAAEERVLAEPAPQVMVGELADSSVNLVVRPWVKQEDFIAVGFALTQAVKERFDRDGISIPFPQRDVHLFQVGDGEAAG